MNIDSDEDETLTEDNGQTPAMTPAPYDGQRMWGWGGRVRMSEESMMSGETERQATSGDKGKRPAAPDHSPSVDSVVPALPSANENGNGTGKSHVMILVSFSFWFSCSSFRSFCVFFPMRPLFGLPDTLDLPISGYPLDTAAAFDSLRNP
ncbi:hypothetical protein RSAG8_09027, partial [Rhizoctonia solani AG-8 WAC10335]